jgi:hypothetical protein
MHHELTIGKEKRKEKKRKKKNLITSNTKYLVAKRKRNKANSASCKIVVFLKGKGKVVSMLN